MMVIVVSSSGPFVALESVWKSKGVPVRTGPSFTKVVPIEITSSINAQNYPEFSEAIDPLEPG